jgi:DNA-damage-inducible protein J
MAQLNIRLDDELKARAEELFSELGLSLSAAVSVFFSQAVRERGIPFHITAEEDPFYSESNMRALRESIRQAKEGKFAKSTTLEELLAMEEK